MSGQTTPQLQAPPGACDTHMHIYGPPDRFPFMPGDAHKPPPASVAQYRAMCDRIGITRTVVVQPAGYGLDNRCTLEAVADMGPNARAVLTVDDKVTDAELERMTAGGGLGVRFHMFPGGVLGFDILEEVAARIHNFGWHIQLQMDCTFLPEREAMLRRLPGQLVLDHIGKFITPVGVEHPGFRLMLDLLESGNTWVKLSAPYETSRVGPPGFDDVGTLARALIQAAPERMLWASNWPHPSEPADAKPDEAMLLDTLLHWADDDATRHRILVDNPAELYGF